MTYSTSNPPRLLIPAVGTAGGSFWLYDSTDADTVVRQANYITDADDLGLKVGDIIFQTDTVGGTVAHIYAVNSVTAGGACDLSNGTAITATDSD